MGIKVKSPVIETPAYSKENLIGILRKEWSMLNGMVALVEDGGTKTRGQILEEIIDQLNHLTTLSPDDFDRACRAAKLTDFSKKSLIHDLLDYNRRIKQGGL